MEAKDLGVETTTMSIRETLMEYFKGSCVERLTENSNAAMFRIEGPRNYQYQRREMNNQSPAVIVLGNLPLMTVQKAPERVVFNAKVLTRSPQLKGVYISLKDFMDKYLQGVEVKHSQKGVIYAH